MHELEVPKTSRQHLIDQIKQSKLEGATWQRYLHLREALEIFGEYHGGDWWNVLGVLIRRLEEQGINKHTPELRLREIMCVLRLYGNCAMMGREPFIGA